MARLGGIRALVTGGTSGIGASIVERFRSEGAAVVMTGRDQARGSEVAARTGRTSSVRTRATAPRCGPRSTPRWRGSGASTCS